MGSAKVSNAKPQLAMENKPAKTPIFDTIKKLFNNKKKDRAKCEKKTEINIKESKRDSKNNIEQDKIQNTNAEVDDSKVFIQENKRGPNTAVNNILNSIDIGLKLKDKEKEHPKERKPNTPESEDELSTRFNFKIIKDEDKKRHSSEDSGFSESKDGEPNDSKVKEIVERFATLKIEQQKGDIVESLNKLKLDEDEKEEKREKKLQNVFSGRGIDRSKRFDPKIVPYHFKEHASNFRHTGEVRSQINVEALSGGNLIINAPPDNYNEVDQALQQFQKASQTLTSINKSEYFEDVLEYINNDSKPEDVLKDFEELQAQNYEINMPSIPIPVTNPIEEFTDSHNLPNYEESIDFNDPLLNLEQAKMDYIFPTPPRSENIPSPMSESINFYPSNWENSLSPTRSSPINSEYEKYQDISQFEELSPISENNEKKRERTSSLSSMTMKNFKDLIKEISNEFSKKDCCEIQMKTCKEIFDLHMGKLKSDERMNLCFRVSKMDLNSAYQVLQHILVSLSNGNVQENLQYALFVIICQRLLAQTPVFFIEDFGLELLKLAVMRNHHRPMLSRIIVYYVYAALRDHTAATKEDCVFHEVDAQGDNLIIACARGGDTYALVLSEITRSDVRGSLPPLFKVDHANTDGYTALHVACSQHSAASPRLHVLHVLLEHAQADVWKGDVKGGDSALHLAVNSVNCDLRVIMMIFKQLDRKTWKKLAHFQNLSSVTPLEYARSASKSTARQNYPQEVLDFLKKCR